MEPCWTAEWLPKTAISGLDATPQAAAWWRYERFPPHLRHLPRDYSLAIGWLRPSFLTRDHWTPGRKGRDIHGTLPVRYVEQAEAAVHAARSRHVCQRSQGDRAMTKPDTPFPKHWRYYIFIKWALIAGAAILALKLVGVW
jgi:hypothetical protein